MKIKPYEISLWDDVLTYVVKDGDTVTLVTSLEGVTGEVINQFYDERKICIIGSNTMTSPARALESTLTKNVNGQVTLTFQMYRRYYDNEKGILTDNPFINLLVNERKIKVKYDNKWYDLIIKNIDETSDSYLQKYTATRLQVNELSKTGFSLVLDTELENNTGTIIELARKVVAETDWEIDEENSDSLVQTIEEPLYAITLKSAITGHSIETDGSASQSISVTAGKVIYAFYSSIIEKKSFFQFLYSTSPFETDDDRVIQNVPNYYIENVSFDSTTGLPSFASASEISLDYRGNRIVRKASTIYDPVLERVVSLYKNDIRGYTETDYVALTSVQNFVSNSENFVDTNGWAVDREANKLEWTVYPKVTQTSDFSKTITSYLKVNFSQSGTYLYNSGCLDQKASINSMAAEEQYVFRLKAFTLNGTTMTPITSSAGALSAYVSLYELDSNGHYSIQSDTLRTLSFTGTSTYQDGYYYITARVLRPLSYSLLTNKKVGFFLTPTDSNSLNKDIYIQDVQFFRYYLDENGSMVTPGMAPTTRIDTLYYYYKYDSAITSADEIEYLAKTREPSSAYTPLYSDSNGYQKVRSIKVSESNRFNIIQDLCELFECWADFVIEHDENGKTSLDKDYRQKKKIAFREYIGKDNYAGFRYGINLQSIQRTLDSDQLISKIIVKNNSNEYANDGFCSIARAEDNPIKENFLYNFTYYINQGLIKYGTIMNDLYSDYNKNLGYYKKIAELNEKRDEAIEAQTQAAAEITRLEAQIQVYSLAYEAALSESLSLKSQLSTLCGYSYDSLISASRTDQMGKWLDNDKVKELIAGITTQVQSAQSFKTLLDVTQASYEEQQIIYNEKKDFLNNEKTGIAAQKEELNKAFYKKYSRFIQEGTWVSEDYMDDDLYYLDAESVLYTSIFPKVTYNIKVIEISQLDGYQGYHSDIGDKTYIEDTEFFGWVTKNGVKTPYKEEIVVSETTNYFDSPDQDSITVQNYKTQFDDLFQRITATTQSVEYTAGAYNKAANIVNTDGTIKATTLQNSMANNALVFSNSKDQSVVWDETGITITCLTRPNEIVRLVSGGILLSKDGGETWGAGITGNGINASYMTAGQLDASVINIYGGSFSAFRWDATGLNAYQFDRDENDNPSYFNYGKFIRFDQYGLYGVRGTDEFIPTSVSDIESTADFALTWDGFFIKSNHKEDSEPDTGYISISSNDDLVVVDGNGVRRIKVGRLAADSSGVVYGLETFDSSGNTVFATGGDGSLYLRKKMYVGPDTYSPRTQLGTVKTWNDDSGEIDSTRSYIYSKIFSVSNPNGEEKIAFYDDGRLVAEEATIKGTIYADAGKIGNMTIGDVTGTIKDVQGFTVNSADGLSFKVGTSGVSPSELNFEITLIGCQEQSQVTRYLWYGGNDGKNWVQLQESTSKTFKFIYVDIESSFDSNGIYYLRAQVKLDGTNILKTTYLTINKLTDGQKGDDGVSAYRFQIDSTQGFVINTDTNSATKTVLTARIFKGATELDTEGEWDYNWYEKKDGATSFSLIGTRKNIEYNLSSFTKNIQIYFTVESDETTTNEIADGSDIGY